MQGIQIKKTGILARLKFLGIRLVIILSLAGLWMIWPAMDGLAAPTPKKLTKQQKQKTGTAKPRLKKRSTGKRSSKKKLKTAKGLRKARSSVALHKAPVPDRNPLVEIVPLENGHYLLKLLDHPLAKKPQEDTPGTEPHAELSTSTSSSRPSPDSISGQTEPVSPQAISPESRVNNEDRPRQESYYKRFYRLLLASAKQLLDVPYRYGGVSALKGLDCSAFVQKVFAKIGIELPRSSREQVKVGMLVTNKYDWSKLRIGDVLFFKRSPGSGQIGHTGIYIGKGQMIHAARADRSVTISSLENAYYEKTFVAAKRFFIFSPSQYSNI